MNAKVAIIGGGLSGLTAAFDLARAGARISLYEAGPNFGGKIWSSDVGGHQVDAGPDTFLARVPHGRQLVEDLGLTDQLESPVAPVPAYLRHKDRLVPLPTGTILGVPTDLDALAASGLISAEGIELARQDFDLPATPVSTETTVGSYCRARLGAEITERLIDPMIGGINASDIDTLSLELGAPQLAAAASRSPSLIQGLLAARASVGATLGSAREAEPVFYGLKGGMAQLIDRLAEAASEAGADLRLNAPVRDITQIRAEHSALIIATEAHSAAQLLRPVSGAAADSIGQIRHASVSQVTLSFQEGQVHPNLDASGILFPRVDGLILTAATWFSTKWERYKHPGDILIRLTSGRFNDSRAAQLDDAALTAQLLRDLSTVISIEGSPKATRVVRWPDAFPQYEPGHAQWVANARAALAEDAPGTHLIGNSYDGIGIPASIALARKTAAAVVNA